jgi:hypothetical protein
MLESAENQQTPGASNNCHDVAIHHVLDSAVADPDQFSAELAIVSSEENSIVDWVPQPAGRGRENVQIECRGRWSWE